jgi:hypothetical protein
MKISIEVVPHNTQTKQKTYKQTSNKQTSNKQTNKQTNKQKTTTTHSSELYEVFLKGGNFIYLFLTKPSPGSKFILIPQL